MDRDVRPAGEGEDALSAVADEPIVRRHHALERLGDRGAIDIRQHRIESCALALAGDENGNIFEEEAGMTGLAAVLARLAGHTPYTLRR
jgi:hypothetical protein